MPFVKFLTSMQPLRGVRAGQSIGGSYLFYSLVLIAAAILDNLFGITFEYSFYGAIYCIAALVLFLPNLAVTVRRLHDINKSGWNILWGIIPLIGSILLIVWCCQDSNLEANQYGESPKYL